MGDLGVSRPPCSCIVNCMGIGWLLSTAFPVLRLHDPRRFKEGLWVLPWMLRWSWGLNMLWGC